MYGEGYLARLPRLSHWWGVYEDGVLVAACSADLAYPPGDDDRPVVLLTSASVLPSHRGRGLQRKMIAARVRWARKINARYVHSYTYDNPVSTVNLARSGFYIKSVRGRKINLRKDLL